MSYQPDVMPMADTPPPDTDFLGGLANSFGCMPDIVTIGLGLVGGYFLMGGRGLIGGKKDQSWGIYAVSLAAYQLYYKYVAKGCG